jgi:cytochrome c-type biogenesis protein CcsB
MSFLLFHLSLAVYCTASAIYLAFFITQNKKLRHWGRILFFTAAGLHTVNILFRYMEAGHTPITSVHEIISFFAWSIACCHLSFRWRYTVKNFGVFAVVLVTVLMLLSAFAPQEIMPLPPSKRSWLLPIHASIAIVADAFLALAAIGGGMYLIQERQLKHKHFGFLYTRMPSLEALDKLNQHCISIGFLLMTVGMFTGYIWARQVWGGQPWHWESKIVFAFITWLIYAGLLHQRFNMGWRGRRAALLTLAAFCVVLVTFGFILLMQVKVQ